MYANIIIALVILVLAGPIAGGVYVSGWCLRAFYQWWTTPTADPYGRIVDEIDQGDVEVVKQISTPLQRRIAYAFKEKFGDVRDNKANRVIAGDFVRAYLMGVTDLRTVDRVRTAPMAIELCLIPIMETVEAAEVRSSVKVKERRAVLVRDG